MYLLSRSPSNRLGAGATRGRCRRNGGGVVLVHDITGRNKREQGSLYEHTPAGKQAAGEDVVIPHPEGERDEGAPEDHPDPKGQPRGEGQAEINREDDPPA